MISSDQITIGFTRLLSFVRGGFLMLSLRQGVVEVMLENTSQKLFYDVKQKGDRSSKCVNTYENMAILMQAVTIYISS